jgi:hypothetical protein
MSQCNNVPRALVSALVLYAGMVAPSQAQNSAKEVGPGASPKVIACMNACEQTQMGCLQNVLQIPIERRTIKDINQVHACNRTEERCDHQCRGK